MDEILSTLDGRCYDLVLSVGPACRPAQQIKTAGLRFTAAPMDWMELYPMSSVVHIFATGFSDFFTDIEEECPPKGKNRRVVDRVNQITSIHHFPAAKSLAEGQAAMRKTMLRRYKRIHKLLRKADRVCFLCNRPDDAGALEEFLADFSALYPGAAFDLINIRDTDTDGLTVIARPAGDGLLVEAAFQDVHPNGGDIAVNPLAWHGNTPMWQAVLGHVHLSQKAVRRANSPWRALLERH